MNDMWIRLAGTLAASTLAVAGGIHMGRSTIAEINPAYFSPPESAQFFADLVPPGYNPQGLQYAQAEPTSNYGRSVNEAIYCPGCELVDYGRSALVRDQLGEPPEWSAAPVTDPERTIESRFDIDRYANFPVTREEERRSTPSTARAKITVETAQTPDEHWTMGDPVGM